MLNKKSAFKPKAAIRRPAPGPGSQGSRHASAAEGPSQTPAPQEPSSPSHVQPAPHQAPGAATDVNPPVSRNGPSGDVEAHQLVPAKETETAAIEPTPQATTDLIPAARVAQQRDERTTSTAPPTTAPENELPTPSRFEEPSPEGPPAVQEAAASRTPAVDKSPGRRPGIDVQPAAATTSPNVPTAPTAGNALFTEDPTSRQTPGVTPTSDNRAPASQTRAARAVTVSSEGVVSEQSHPTVTAAIEPAAGPSTATKPNPSQKRTAVATPGKDSVESRTTAPPKKRPRKRAAPLPGEGAHQEGAAATPRATRSRKRSRSATENGETEADGEHNTAPPKRRPPRPQRETTPPDAENVEIDVTQVKMADLAKDMHVGKKFSLHDELMEREKAKRLRYNEKRKRQQNGEDCDVAAEDGEVPAGTSSSKANSTSARATPVESAATAEPPSGTPRAPIGEQYQIIDGEIVLDHRSLQVDRHARAREEAGELVEVEENDFTHHTTSATYLRRNLKPQQWTDEETNLFYQALHAFGTDFDTICRMFKGKTRKHIKLKFNREERVAPERINAALVGQKTVSIDMEQYQRATGQEYETAEAIYAEQRRAEAEFEARQKALEDEKAEEVRRKKEEVLAQLNSAVDGENNNGGGGGSGGDGVGNKRKRGGRKKKAANVVGL